VFELKLIRFLLRLLGAIAPGAAAWWACRMLMRPQRHPQQSWEATTPGDFDVHVIEGGLVARSWGSGPAVLLLHGWSGRYTQFGPLIEALRKAGLKAVAIDPPAHGDSPGKTAHPIAFADAAFAAAEAFGPVAAVVGHSMGAGAVAYSLTLEQYAPRAVLIAGPASMSRVLGRYADLLELGNAVRVRLFLRTGRLMGIAEHELDIERIAPPPGVRFLLVQDREDKEVPVGEAEAIARHWTDSTLHLTRGLGHTRLLADPETVQRIVTFIAR
jgi:pimeloyl-ACP methyl ester carboxylesterase